MKEIKVGETFRGKRIREFVKLSTGQYVLKTDNSKSKDDFKVRAIFSLKPLRSLTPKHAHFAIDLYGKLCANKEKAAKIFKAIIEVWRGTDVKTVLAKYKESVENLPGYDLEYILHSLQWILDQEDVNFTGRPKQKQEELNEICSKQGIVVPREREGSQLAISLLCDIIAGKHPVEAFLRANLDVLPRKRR